jgi:hypothetical protein
MLIPGIYKPGDYDVIFQIVKAENAFTDGDIAQFSDTASTAYPLGIAVEDSVAGDGRVAGVIVEDMAAGDYGKCQIYGYNTNITTDGNVAATDLFLTAGAAVAVGKTNAEVNADITTANFLGLKDVFAWNISVDVGTVGQGFIKVMGL